ncbi:MAG: PUA domain-containing protein [Candidatus Hodarchaeales archaeon]
MARKEELSKKRWKKTVNKAKEIFQQDYLSFLQSKKSLFLVKYSEEYEIIYDDEAQEPLLLIRMKDSEIIPSLQSLRKFTNLMPKIWTDAGATKFLLNGANLFRPGITKFDSFEKNQIVQVVNPQGNVLSIGEVMFSSKDMPDKGEVLKIISYLNDEIWSIAKVIR